MKQLPRIAAKIFCEPWSILPGAHAQIVRQFRAYLERGGSPSNDPYDDPETEDPCCAKPDPGPGCDAPCGPAMRREDGTLRMLHSQVQLLGNIAILPISGIIGKHLSGLEMLCGGCDSAVIAQQARAIAADSRVTTVIVAIDSPGGACVGAPECARAILAMSLAGLDTIAFTDTHAASNGYFMAAACDEIWAASSAMVGSISTYVAFKDESAAYAMAGVQIQMFRTGEVKGVGTEGKPWTPAENDAMQLVADQYGDQFKSFVKARRGLSDDLMQGQFWPAEYAPSGLVDGLADDLDSLISAIRKTSPV